MEQNERERIMRRHGAEIAIHIYHDIQDCGLYDNSWIGGDGLPADIRERLMTLYQQMDALQVYARILNGSKAADAIDAAGLSLVDDAITRWAATYAGSYALEVDGNG